MSKRYWLAVLEGVDGVGKSTVGRRMAELSGAAYLATPLLSLSSCRAEVDRALNAPLPRKLWYAAQVAMASEEAAKLCAQNRCVVMDRYWLSTLAYSSCDNEKDPLAGIGDRLHRPDFTFFLTLDPREREKRLTARGEMQAHDRRFLRRDEEQRLRRNYQRLANLPAAGTFTEIAIDNLTPDECARLLLERIENGIAC